MDVGEPGMETLMLLARNTPLPADVDLKALLSGFRHGEGAGRCGGLVRERADSNR